MRETVDDRLTLCEVFFFFNDTATTEIYTLSLHDALPICSSVFSFVTSLGNPLGRTFTPEAPTSWASRSEEHTSELQSQFHLVCRLLLEKKKKNNKITITLKTKKNKKMY